MTRKTNKKTKILILASLIFVSIVFITVMTIISNKNDNVIESSTDNTISSSSISSTFNTPESTTLRETKLLEEQEKLIKEGYDSGEIENNDNDSDYDSEILKEKEEEIFNAINDEDYEDYSPIIYQDDNISPHGQHEGESIDEIKMNYKSISVNKYNFLTLQLFGAKSSVNWSSSDESILKVYNTASNKCTYKAMSIGKVVAIATYNNKKYTCEVTVN